MFRAPPSGILIACVAALLIPSVAAACLWDHDTIKMERTRFPGTLELISGKFLRHSPEFYQWRIQDRMRRLESDPTNPALLDDLAVAYDKTGQHDLAIETALKTERLWPGRYETAANLGTFYIHAGKPGDGLPHIDRALRINPDAHFGREKYQRLLVEYALHRRPSGRAGLPLADVTVVRSEYPGNRQQPIADTRDTFAAYLFRGRQGLLPPAEAAAAVKGVLGMMRFGKHDSPALLEALGALLVADVDGYSSPRDAKLLAARAFLRASYEVPDETARVAYRAMAARALVFQTARHDSDEQVALDQVEASFRQELDDARVWYAELRERELSWVRGAADPEAEFDKLYAVEPELPGMEVEEPSTEDDTALDRSVTGPTTVFILVAVTVLAVVVWRARRSRAPAV
jgi:tetratricopeptide (TPR) repeat protein